MTRIEIFIERDQIAGLWSAGQHSRLQIQKSVASTPECVFAQRSLNFCVILQETWSRAQDGLQIPSENLGGCVAGDADSVQSLRLRAENRAMPAAREER